MNSRGLREYDKLKNLKVIRIGAIGGYNKGKSLVLSKLSKMDFPEGRTKGLCIKYSDNLENNNERRFVLLDSIGFENIINGDNINENILLFVVGIMNYYEQKYLNRIKRLLRK